MKKKISLMVVAATVLLAAHGSAWAQVYYGLDHLKCYKVKDPSKIAATVDLMTMFMDRVTGTMMVPGGVEPGCTVSKAKLLCLPADKSNVILQVNGVPTLPLPLTATDAREARLCYKVKCPLEVPAFLLPGPFSVVDQFGARTVTRGSAQLLCTPAIDQMANVGYCGDGALNGSEQCDAGSPGVACTNPSASCGNDCQCHGATACCYADVIPIPPNVGCLEYYGTEAGANAFINDCNTGFDLLPGFVIETGLPGSCTISPFGSPCTALTTIDASGTP